MELGLGLNASLDEYPESGTTSSVSALALVTEDASVIQTEDSVDLTLEG